MIMQMRSFHDSCKSVRRHKTSNMIPLFKCHLYIPVQEKTFIALCVLTSSYARSLDAFSVAELQLSTIFQCVVALLAKNSFLVYICLLSFDFKMFKKEMRRESNMVVGQENDKIKKERGKKKDK